MKKQQKVVFVAMLALIVVMTAALPVLAGGAAGPLADVWTSLVDWAQGNVGKVISLAMILVGIVAGVANQSLMAFAVGIGGGLGLYNAPTIIDTVFSATLHAGMF